jgi:hypothetical protein
LEESVAQVYEQAKVQRDFYPPGFSHWQLVEKFINYIDSEITCRATEEKQDGEWDKDRLKTVFQEIIENITREQVKGFYRACFVDMFLKVVTETQMMFINLEDCIQRFNLALRFVIECH